MYSAIFSQFLPSCEFPCELHLFGGMLFGEELSEEDEEEDEDEEELERFRNGRIGRAAHALLRLSL